MATRRTILLAPVAAAAIPAVAARRKMTLCIHQTTSLGAGYRKSLEGWAKAGIKNVELSAGLLEDFLKSDTLDGARKIISDLDLKVVSGAALAPELFTDRPGRAAALETFKRRCALFKALGADKVYTPSVPTGKVTAEDFKAAPGYIREFGEIARQHDLIAMLEFLRDSALIATMSTLMKLIRDAGHPSVRPMLDFYHFWSGMSKFEDLDLLGAGELAHVHFQDTPNIPRELLTQTTRVIPGDGVTPLVRILAKLAQKGYTGSLSVELFLPEFQQGDPYGVARRIREKAEAVMRQAGVI
jgi:sugar phosphate isomerase/epimerase